MNGSFHDPTKEPKNCQLCYTSGQTLIKRKERQKSTALILWLVYKAAF
jgi:hypothetical protein